MSERKVLNKYYPPDFDPSKIPRLRLAKNRQYTVRLMAPCNMRCNTCGDYIAKGKKFNARKETVETETYLGLKVFRFYFKCPRCMAEITFKTDPKSMDYEVEHGATPNFKALKLAELQAEQEAKDKEEEEKLNPMKLLENRTKASRLEMESIEALEDLKEMSQRQRFIDYEQILQNKIKEEEENAKRQEEEDEAFVRSIFPKIESNSDQPIVKLLPDIDSSDSDEELKPKLNANFLFENKCTNVLSESDIKTDESKQNKFTSKRKLQETVIIKKREKSDNSSLITVNNDNNSINNKSCNLSLNLCAYSDSDSE